MSRDKLIVIGVVVLGVLGVLVYRQVKSDAEIGAPRAASKDLPSIAADEVDKISITNGEKGEVVLEKTGPADPDAGTASWVMTKPVKAPVNAQTVKDLVSNLKDLKIDSEISLKLDDEVKKDKQLDTAHAVHVVAWKGADKKTDAYFGKSGAIGQLVMVEGRPDKVYAAKGYSSWLYTKEAKDWRNKEIFKFDDANVNQATVENKNGVFSFTKGDKGWAGTVKGAELAKLDEDKVKNFVRDFKSLSAEDFGDGKPASETGLDQPEATVTFSLKDNAGKYVLKVGKASANGTSRFAVKDGDETIFVIGKSASEWATADKEKFQKTPDAGAGEAKDAPKPPMGMPMGMPPGHP
jgi:hypothetical protein